MSQLILFGIFCCVLLLLYWPVRHYLLIDDGISGLWEVRDMPWTDFFHSFGYGSLYQFHYLSLVIMERLFGIESQYYFIVLTVLHAFIACYIVQVFRQLLTFFKIAFPVLFSFLLALFFVSSPHLFETMAWAGPSHYVITLLLYLIMFNEFFKALNKQVWNKFVFFTAFVMAVFTFEMSMMFLPSFILLALLLRRDEAFLILFKRLAALYVPMFLVLVVAYTYLYFQTKTLIPHGMSMDAMGQSFSIYGDHLIVYLSRIWGYSQALSFPLREGYYSLVSAYYGWGVLLLLVVVVIVFIKKKRLALFLFFNGVLFLLPYLFRSHSVMNQFENMRFAYFAFVFIMASVLVLLWQKSAVLSTGFIIILLIINTMTSLRGVHAKVLNGQLHEQYLSELNKFEAAEYYLLNVPSFCQGHFVFRADNRLGIAAQMHAKKEAPEAFKEVMWYYAQSVSDSFDVEVMNDSTLSIQPRTDGVWLMDEDRGASNYETDDYKVEIGEWSRYTVTFKKKHNAKKSVVLLYSKGELIEINLSLPRQSKIAIP